MKTNSGLGVVNHETDDRMLSRLALPVWAVTTLRAGASAFGILILLAVFWGAGPVEKAAAEHIQSGQASAAKDLALAQDPKTVRSGRRIFMVHCSRCHGMTATGARSTGGGGPNLTDAVWFHGDSFGEMVHTVTDGVRGTLMKSWKTTLTEKRIRQVVAFVYGLRFRGVHEDPE